MAKAKTPMNKQKRKELKEKRRAQPGFTGTNSILLVGIRSNSLTLILEKEGIQRAVNTLANRRRQKLRKILESNDKGGLTKLGSQQLQNFLRKKTPVAERLSMADLEPSAKKVLDSLLVEEYDELPAWFDARKIGGSPKAKKVGEGEETGFGDNGGKKEEEKEGIKDLEEEDDDEGGYMAPVPVTP